MVTTRTVILDTAKFCLGRCGQRCCGVASCNPKPPAPKLRWWAAAAMNQTLSICLHELANQIRSKCTWPGVSKRNSGMRTVIAKANRMTIFTFPAFLDLFCGLLVRHRLCSFFSVVFAVFRRHRHSITFRSSSCPSCNVQLPTEHGLHTFVLRLVPLSWSEASGQC